MVSVTNILALNNTSGNKKKQLKFVTMTGGSMVGVHTSYPETSMDYKIVRIKYA